MTTYHCFILNIKALGLIVSMKIIEVFIMSMRASEPRDVANLEARGMVGRIYEGDHLMLLNTV